MYLFPSREKPLICFIELPFGSRLPSMTYIDFFEFHDQFRKLDKHNTGREHYVTIKKGSYKISTDWVYYEEHPKYSKA
jgi:hypothetical protein